MSFRLHFGGSNPHSFYADSGPNLKFRACRSGSGEDLIADLDLVRISLQICLWGLPNRGHNNFNPCRNISTWILIRDREAKEVWIHVADPCGGSMWRIHEMDPCGRSMR